MVYFTISVIGSLFGYIMFTWLIKRETLSINKTPKILVAVMYLGTLLFGTLITFAIVVSMTLIAFAICFAGFLTKELTMKRSN